MCSIDFFHSLKIPTYVIFILNDNIQFYYIVKNKTYFMAWYQNIL